VRYSHPPFPCPFPRARHAVPRNRHSFHLRVPPAADAASFCPKLLQGSEPKVIAAGENRSGEDDNDDATPRAPRVTRYRSVLNYPGINPALLCRELGQRATRRKRARDDPDQLSLSVSVEDRCSQHLAHQIIRLLPFRVADAPRVFRSLCTRTHVRDRARPRQSKPRSRVPRVLAALSRADARSGAHGCPGTAAFS